MQSPPELSPEQFAQMLAGERCGCGHHVRSHLPAPYESPDDVKTGACKVKKCDCKGLIDLTGADA